MQTTKWLAKISKEKRNYLKGSGVDHKIDGKAGEPGSEKERKRETG